MNARRIITPFLFGAAIALAMFAKPNYSHGFDIRDLNLIKNLPISSLSAETSTATAQTIMGGYRCFTTSLIANSTGILTLEVSTDSVNWIIHDRTFFLPFKPTSLSADIPFQLIRSSISALSTPISSIIVSEIKSSYPCFQDVISRYRMAYATSGAIAANVTSTATLYNMQPYQTVAVDAMYSGGYTILIQQSADNITWFTIQTTSVSGGDGIRYLATVTFPNIRVLVKRTAASTYGFHTVAFTTNVD